MLEMGLAKFYMCTKFEESSFIPSKFKEGGLKFKNSTRDPDRALFYGTLSVVTLDMGHAKIYPYTKFEISSFIRSRFTEGGLKFSFWSLNLITHFWGLVCHAVDGTCQVL